MQTPRSAQPARSDLTLSTSCARTHTHTHGMSMQPAVARPSAHHKQGCVGRRSLCLDSLAALLFHLFPAVVLKLSWQRGQGDECQHPACCYPLGCHPRPPPAARSTVLCRTGIQKHLVWWTKCLQNVARICSSRIRTRFRMVGPLCFSPPGVRVVAAGNTTNPGVSVSS